LNDIFVLDACALIALLLKEIGYKNVEKIIERSNKKEANLGHFNYSL